MQQTSIDIGQLIGGIPGKANVDAFIDAQEAATAAIANAHKSSADVRRHYQFELPLEQPEVRPIGKAILEPEEKAFVRDIILAKQPLEVGLSHRTWSIQAVRDYIAAEYEVTVSPSSARNYIKQWGLSAPAPLNRKTAQQRSSLEQDWMVEQFPKLKTTTKAAGQRMIWLSAKQATGQTGTCTVVHAVSNTNRKTSWLSLPAHNRIGVLNDLFDSMCDGFTGKPLVLFDESISEDFKAEIQAFLSAKHGSRKDGGGKTKKKRATLPNAQKWLMSILGLKADFWPVMMTELGDDTSKCDPEGQRRNERSCRRFNGADDYLAEGLIEVCASDLASNAVNSDVFEDAIGWLTSENSDVQSFRWCAGIVGIEPDAYRAALMLEIAKTKVRNDPTGEKTAQKRKEALSIMTLYV
ncbi:MAG: winged helix-turn-helix domain-containing protein [Azonexaceae bacterium]|nr:winged helix-turn-helix domain-containing protein [Azonexaceae bacterium]